MSSCFFPRREAKAGVWCPGGGGTCLQNKCKAVLGLQIPSSINGAVAAEQESANMVFTSQKVALRFELKQFS